MRRLRVVLVAVLAGAALPVASADNAGTESSSWAKLKSLVGDWEGTYEGKRSTVSYRLVSSGTALMETMETPDASQMVTLYHPDGASLLMTHGSPSPTWTPPAWPLRPRRT